MTSLAEQSITYNRFIGLDPSEGTARFTTDQAYNDWGGWFMGLDRSEGTARRQRWARASHDEGGSWGSTRVRVLQGGCTGGLRGMSGGSEGTSRWRVQ